MISNIETGAFPSKETNNFTNHPSLNPITIIPHNTEYPLKPCIYSIFK
jgi:hypothetical protein